jgi:hypothetical protein
MNKMKDAENLGYLSFFALMCFLLFSILLEKWYEKGKLYFFLLVVPILNPAEEPFLDQDSTMLLQTEQLVLGLLIVLVGFLFYRLYRSKMSRRNDSKFASNEYFVLNDSKFPRVSSLLMESKGSPQNLVRKEFFQFEKFSARKG